MRRFWPLTRQLVLNCRHRVDAQHVYLPSNSYFFCNSFSFFYSLMLFSVVNAVDHQQLKRMPMIITKWMCAYWKMLQTEGWIASEVANENNEWLEFDLFSVFHQFSLHINDEIRMIEWKSKRQTNECDSSWIDEKQHKRDKIWWRGKRENCCYIQRSEMCATQSRMIDL